jgi:hypothetical protein
VCVLDDLACQLPLRAPGGDSDRYLQTTKNPHPISGTEALSHSRGATLVGCQPATHLGGSQPPRLPSRSLLTAECPAQPTEALARSVRDSRSHSRKALVPASQLPPALCTPRGPVLVPIDVCTLFSCPPILAAGSPCCQPAGALRCAIDAAIRNITSSMADRLELRDRGPLRHGLVPISS